VNVSLYQAASALNANERWQEVISENLAASSIPGYKKQDLSFSAVQSGVMQPTASGKAPAFTLPRITSATNFQPGELQPTGGKTDVALDGSGFFVVQTPNGTNAYTRDGEFQINGQGQLTTKQGFLVLGDSGPIQINLSDPTPISISATGQISQGAEVKGKLRVVDFTHPQLLTPVGGGLFVAQNPGLAPADVAQPSVRQGYLEGSNTTSVGEMANMISSMRSFEANQRIIQLQDERMSHAIQALGGAS
jgi:flagellar basal-body rod protein FlgF